MKGKRLTVYVTSRPKLAAVFDCDAQTITRWISRGAPPKTAAGYDLREWLKWWADYRFGSSAGNATSAEADRRWKLARATREELRARKMLGKLVSAEQVKADRLQLVTWFASTLDRAGLELSVKLAGKAAGRPAVVRKIVGDYFYKVREELAGDGQSSGESDYDQEKD